MLNKNYLKSYVLSIIINNSNKWYNKLDLYNDIKNNFEEKELYIGHFLFIWELLLYNEKFILKKDKNTDIYIKYNTNIMEENKYIMEKDKCMIEETLNKKEICNNLFIIDFSNLLNHIILYPNLYRNDNNLLDNFLLHMYGDHNLSKNCTLIDVLFCNEHNLESKLIKSFISVAYKEKLLSFNINLANKDRYLEMKDTKKSCINSLFIIIIFLFIVPFANFISYTNDLTNIKKNIVTIFESAILNLTKINIGPSLNNTFIK